MSDKLACGCVIGQRWHFVRTRCQTAEYLWQQYLAAHLTRIQSPVDDEMAKADETAAYTRFTEHIGEQRDA